MLVLKIKKGANRHDAEPKQGAYADNKRTRRKEQGQEKNCGHNRKKQNQRRKTHKYSIYGNYGVRIGIRGGVYAGGADSRLTDRHAPRHLFRLKNRLRSVSASGTIINIDIGICVFGGLDMGLVYARTEVTNIAGGEESYTLPFLIDTGATDTVIPSNELEKLGIKREYKQDYELADGTVVSYDVGYAFLCVNGVKVASNVVFGDEKSEPLLGVTVLESAGFIVDPIRQILKKTAAIPLK